MLITEYVDYAASKGALDTFTIGLATEIAAEGIRAGTLMDVTGRTVARRRAIEARWWPSASTS